MVKPRPTIIVEGMTRERFDQCNSGINAEFLSKFISFLKRGCFVFCYDD